jgi:UDP-GlcNAc:undecaprenyl-phosphate/decaprenyl-phosphate GlcNAc-1-phosphate transferase
LPSPVPPYYNSGLTEIARLFLVALAGSLALTPVCRYIATRAGYVAAPAADRWHKKPTALLGGVAIALATLGTAVATGRFAAHWEIMACGVLIAAFGLADDLLSLKASTKLIAQVIVASLLLFFGYRLEWTPSLAGDMMLTLFWIVGITNAFNLLDNMDGLCAGTTLIAGTFLVIGFVQDPGATAAAQYGAVLLGATAGFLVYNLYPASIFMGDAGSLFLGFNLAALTLIARPHGSVKSGLLSIVAAPVLLLLIPIFDTTLVTALRLLSGRKPSQGGRDHASHRLVAVGLSERAAVMVLWTLAAGGGAVSVLLLREDPSWGIITALGFLLAMVIFGVYLSRIRVYEAEASPYQGETVTPLVSDFMYKRRAAEVLLDCCLVPLAYYTAYRLRFEGGLLTDNYPFFLRSLPVVLSSQLLALFVVGGYRGTWRYFGMMDAVVFAKGVILGTIGAELVILYLYRFENYSRTVFVIYAVLLLLLLAGSRGSFRLVGEFVSRRQSSGRRCIIYGTGGARIATIRDAFGVGDLRILGFVDESIHEQSRIAGYPVIGGYEELLRLISGAEVDCIVMNTHLVDVERLQRLEAACRDHDVELLRLDVHLKPVSAVS